MAESDDVEVERIEAEEPVVAPSRAASKAKRYRALVGMSYPTPKGEVDIDAGAIVTDLPPGDIQTLLDQGCIKEA